LTTPLGEDSTTRAVTIRTELLKDKPVQFIGHALESWGQLAEQMRAICDVLLDQGEGADLTEERDRGYPLLDNFL